MADLSCHLKLIRGSKWDHIGAVEKVNRYYLISSIFSAIFLIYLWLVWLPEYAGDPVYQTQRTVAIVVSIAMLAVMVMTLFLAKSPVDEVPKDEKGKRGKT